MVTHIEDIVVFDCADRYYQAVAKMADYARSRGEMLKKAQQGLF